MNANKIADTILSWDTDEELSDEEEIYSGAVGDEEVVSPANIGIDSDSSKGESDDDLNPSLHLLCRYLLSACCTEMALLGNAPIQ